MDELADVVVVDNPEGRRFEAWLGRKVIGWASYDQTSELIVFTHTHVNPRYERLGLGSRLVRATLDHIRSQDMQMLSTCPFVNAWIEQHPDYADLLYHPDDHATS